MTTREMFRGMVGRPVYVCCTGYAYSGTLQAIGARAIVISHPSIVYETGAWGDSQWRDAQALPTPQVVVMLSQVESVFEVVR